MPDLSLLPQIAPEMLLGAGPLPPFAGPIRLTTVGQPNRACPTMMRECFARIGYRYEFTPLPGADFEADLAINKLPGIVVADGKLHGSRNRRTRAIIEDAEDEAAIFINLAGPHLIEQFGKEVVLGDGEAILVSGTDPSCFTHKPPGTLLGLRVAKTRLHPLLADRDRSYMRKIPAASGAMALLSKYLGLTWDAQVTANPTVQRMMSDHIFDLVALAFGPTGDATANARGNGLQAARLAAIKKDVAGLLDRPDIGVHLLAERHGMTPRSIQRLFEADGTTLTKFLLGERLARAHRLLRTRAPSSDKISSVAYDCGFGDVSYFNRAFRRQYGAAPSEIRASEGCTTPPAG